jgi:fructose 5-dehydrogenase cytochrome subunit
MFRNSFLFGLMVTLSFAAYGATATYAANPGDFQTASAQRGAYMAIASDCSACHTAPGGLPFAGGLAINSPVGTIYSTNITPSPSDGIGNYTEAQFARAVRDGVRADGANLYPAMPYTSYRVLTDADVNDLYAYFMHDVAPVNVASHPTSLPFPMNIRMSMKIWNLLFLNNQTFVADPKQSADWNRGAYLATGPAHCSTCHTPRGFLMEELSGSNLAGAQVDAWYAPNVTSDPVSGIGSWTQADLAQYLHTGVLPGKAQAAGGMGEAVEHSFQHLSPSDINAIATYIHTIPAMRNPSDVASRFSYGKPSLAVASLRGENGVRSYTGTSPSGAELFQSNCASCHQAFGQGTKDGYYPSLFHNSATGAGNPDNLIAAILYGVDRSTSNRLAFMPGFGGLPSDSNQLSNDEIATLSNFVLEQFGRVNGTVTAADVAQARRGAPSSSLVLLARIGIAVGAFVVLVALIIFGLWLQFRRKAIQVIAK